jgi:hypothetical protein
MSVNAILRLAGGAGASDPFAQDVIDAGVGSLCPPAAASSSESDDDNEIRRIRGPPELNDMFFEGSFSFRRLIGDRPETERRISFKKSDWPKMIGAKVSPVRDDHPIPTFLKNTKP